MAELPASFFQRELQGKASAMLGILPQLDQDQNSGMYEKHPLITSLLLCTPKTKRKTKK